MEHYCIRWSIAHICRVEASLSVEDERRVVTTARNVCKAITSRRNVLAELQRRFSDLSTRYRLMLLLFPLVFSINE